MTKILRAPLYLVPYIVVAGGLMALVTLHTRAGGNGYVTLTLVCFAGATMLAGIERWFAQAFIKSQTELIKSQAELIGLTETEAARQRELREISPEMRDLIALGRRSSN